MAGTGNPMYGKHHSESAREKLRIFNTGKVMSEEARLKMIKGVTGLKRTPDAKEKIRRAQTGKTNSFYGREHSPATKRRLREITLERCRRDNRFIAFNRKGCDFFDKLNGHLNWHGQHALSGGEKEMSGYSVDYYNPELNLIIEWDEEHHYKGTGHSLTDKDLVRQRNLLMENCRFYRVREKTGEVSKVDGYPDDYTEKIKSILATTP
jgi:hypothetical protein